MRVRFPSPAPTHEKGRRKAGLILLQMLLV